MQRTENDSADKKNWMSSAQLWSNGTTCDYKKEDSASESKNDKFFLGFLGIKISNICFCFFYYSEAKKTIGLCWRTRLSHGVSEKREGHLRHQRKRTRFHKSLAFRL